MEYCDVVANLRKKIGFGCRLDDCHQAPASCDIKLPRTPPILPSTAHLCNILEIANVAAMAPAANKASEFNALNADYAAPALIKEFRHPLPSSSVSNTEEKTQYLSTLRDSVVKLQDEINIFLTSKMEEDKVSAIDAGKRINEKTEEENYGEEQVDEDA